jgi:L-amino acid N-acyltransferase YncA
MSIAIRDATQEDAEAICRIYNPHVLRTIVTFEEIEVTPRQMKDRIAAVTAEFPWLVAERDGALVGYAYASKWRDRTAYRHSSESTVYVDEATQGHGFGKALYAALLEGLRMTPIRTVLGVIALPNAASVALHEKLGFKKVAHLDRVGFKLGRWIDVGYWQILL